MRVLITGSAGLIGTETARQLTAIGIETVEYDIAYDAGDPRHGDVRDFERLRDKLTNCVGAIHLAAVSRVIFGERDPSHCWNVNVGGTHALLRAALDQPFRRRPWLIYASSREVYGNSFTLPVSEDAPLRPINQYGRTKMVAEQQVTAARSNGLVTATLRFSNVFGSVHDHADRVVPAFARTAAVGGVIVIEGSSSTFDFTHVLDVSGGIASVVQALRKNRALPTIHFVGGRGTSLLELAHIARESAFSHVELREVPARGYHVDHFRGDPRRAEALLGWRTEVPLEVGVRDLIVAYADHLHRFD